MNRKIKKDLGALKYIVLLIVLIVLAITFYATRENDDNQIQNNDNPNISDNPIIKPNNNPSDNLPNSNSSDNPNQSSQKENPNDDETITGGMDNISTTNYIIYDKYVIASENTKYSQSGYKYFLVRSYTEYEKYITNNLQSPFDTNYVSPFENTNTQTLETLKQAIDKEFFKSNCLLFVVDYGQKELGGEINNIQIVDNTVSLYIDRTVDVENKSKYTTYIIPINSTQIKSADINYIR